MEGRFARIEMLDAERHAAQLHAANALDREGRIWTYLPYGPYEQEGVYRDWMANMDNTHYVLGTACGPHPFPEMVCYFQSIIGQEARRQVLVREGKLPARVYACVGGGSNAMGIFSGFMDDPVHFQAAGQRLVAQYNAYEPLPGLHINGELTLGENIADVSGIAIAFAAYRKSLGGQPAPVIDGLTGEQRFFLAYGQTWRNKMREATLRQRILTDGHSPSRHRAQTVRNIDAWYDAWSAKPGQALYLESRDRVRIW